MDDTEIELQAHLHDEARRTALQIDPVTVKHPEMTIDDAYAIQKRWLQIELERGRELIGHKIGLTSRAMQLAVRSFLLFSYLALQEFTASVQSDCAA